VKSMPYRLLVVRGRPKWCKDSRAKTGVQTGAIQLLQAHRWQEPSHGCCPVRPSSAQTGRRRRSEFGTLRTSAFLTANSGASHFLPLAAGGLRALLRPHEQRVQAVGRQPLRGNGAPVHREFCAHHCGRRRAWGVADLRSGSRPRRGTR